MKNSVARQLRAAKSGEHVVIFGASSPNVDQAIKRLGMKANRRKTQIIVDDRLVSCELVEVMETIHTVPPLLQRSRKRGNRPQKRGTMTGASLRKKREDLGWTQLQMGEKLGVSAQTVLNMEKAPKRKILQKYQDKL